MTTIYRGFRPGTERPDGNVVVVTDSSMRPLPHHFKHSPDGFSWGYEGSGPAELARCLLIHALSVPPHKECGGQGCWYCDVGYEIKAAMYQQFKRDVIAQLAQDEDWELSRTEIKAWAAGYRTGMRMKGAVDD
jgi:hypothetical protein